MKFDFDTIVDRNGRSSLKQMITPQQIQRAGIPSFAASEMDFKTAPCVISSITECAQNGLLGFTLQDDQYNSAVVWWMDAIRHSRISPHWIVPTHGTIFSVATAIRLLTKEGDGVIVQPPTYQRYEQAATRLHRKIVYNPLIGQDGVYQIDFEDLEQTLQNRKNKLLILCNPQNPIGKVWGYDQLTQLAQLAKKYGITVFSDEIFAETVFTEKKTIPYYEIEEARDRCIVSTSLGKAFNFTGVNHANMIIPNDDLRQRFIVQRDADHYGSIDPLTYAAVLGAYSPKGKDWVEQMCNYTKENIDTTIDFFEQYYPEVIISPVEGTFSLWMNWKKLFTDESDLLDFLINKALLHVESGSTYGTPGFTRMNMTTTKSQLYRVLENLKSARKNL